MKWRQLATANWSNVEEKYGLIFKITSGDGIRYMFFDVTNDREYLDRNLRQILDQMYAPPEYR